MSEWVFVAAAYGLTWAGFASFSLYLWRRWARARHQLDETRTLTGGTE